MIVRLPSPDKLSIHIYSDNDTLERQLCASKVQHSIDVELQTVSIMTEDVAYADAFIVCGNPSIIENLRKFFPDALCLWCATSTEVAEYRNIVNVDRLCLLPASPEVMAYQFSLFIKRVIQHREDSFFLKAMHTGLDSIHDLVWIKDNKGTHLKVNDAFCECVGKNKDNVEGYGHYHIWGITEEEYKDSEYVCVDTDVIVTESKKPGVFDELVMSARGMRQFRTYKSPILNDLGELLGTIGIARDVTDLQNIDAKLRIVLDSMPFALLVTDENNTAIHTNPKFGNIFNVEPSKVIGTDFNIENLVSVISRELINEGSEEELLVRLSSGKVIIIVIQQADIKDIFDNVVGNLNIFIDVTQSRETDRRLKELAYTDALTGLCSRHYLFHKLDSRPRTENLFVLTIDLDNFKQVNDEFGHEVGDHVLQQAAQMIKQVFPDDLNVRLGGDEFLIVRIGANQKDFFVSDAAEILQRLEDMFRVQVHSKNISMSGGIAFSIGGAYEDFDALLRDSDKALYRAKRLGKNRIEIF